MKKERYKQMLISKFRDGLKSNVMRYFLLFMCVALVFGGSFRILQRMVTGKSGQEIAFVNKEGIDKALFMAKKHQVEEQFNNLYRQFGAYTPLLLQQQGISADPEKVALDSLIKEKLLDQAVHSFPIYINQEYVKNKIQDPYFMYSNFSYMLPRNFILDDNKIDTQGYLSFIKSLPNGAFVDEVAHMLEQYLLMEAVKQGIKTPSYVMNSLVETQTNTKEFEIHTITLADVKKEISNQVVDPSELQKFYTQENAKNGRYTTPAKRSGILWTFDPSHFSISISDKEIQDHYNKVKQTQFISKPTEMKIREIIFNEVKEKGLKQLLEDAQSALEEIKKSPTDFAKHATHYSHSDSAKNGGLVEFVKGKSKDKAIEKAALRLKHDGDISEIIALDGHKGYAIVQRVSRKDTEYKSLESVKKEVESLLMQRKFATLFTQQANRVIRSKSDKSQQEFEEFLRKHKAVQTKVDPVEKEGNAQSNRLFSMKKVGDKVAYADSKGYILELESILKKIEIPFNLIVKQVGQDYQEAQAHRTLAEKTENLKKALKEGTQLDNLAKKTKLSIKPTDTEAVKKLTEKGLTAEILLCEKRGSLVAMLQDQQASVAVLVNSHSNDDEVNKLKKSVDDSFSKIAQQAFVASLYRDAKIEILLENVTRNNPGDYYDYQV